ACFHDNVFRNAARAERDVQFSLLTYGQFCGELSCLESFIARRYLIAADGQVRKSIPAFFIALSISSEIRRCVSYSDLCVGNYSARAVLSCAGQTRRHLSKSRSAHRQHNEDERRHCDNSKRHLFHSYLQTIRA